MKSKNLFLIPAFIAVLNLILAGRVTAQTFTTLHDFTLSGDGALPYAALILSGNTLYGTAPSGGSSGYGTVFALNTDGAGFTNLYSFTLPACCFFTNSDGAAPHSGLVLANSTLYGTALRGGNSGSGTVFAVNTNGTGFKNLHSFTAAKYANPDLGDTNSDGTVPRTDLIVSGNTLYGTAAWGGSSGRGTVFALNTNGTGFTIVHAFTAWSTNSTGNYTNRDGARPNGVTMSANVLYGTAAGGGSSGYGTVFAVNTDGTGFTTLHNFTGGTDGGIPEARLVLLGNTLYGTTWQGGNSNLGTVFALSTNGTGFTVLHDFSAPSTDPSGVYTNSDGYALAAGLTLSNNTLYGMAQYGGSSGNGTVFAVSIDGSAFTTLHSFTSATPPYTINSDGANPVAGLTVAANRLFGTTPSGGSSGIGTVFSLSFRPQLTITPSGTNLILSWPTNVAGFDYTGYTLQSAPALTAAFADVPGSTSPHTIQVPSAQQFFRLRQ